MVWRFRAFWGKSANVLISDDNKYTEVSGNNSLCSVFAHHWKRSKELMKTYTFLLKDILLQCENCGAHQKHNINIRTCWYFKSQWSAWGCNVDLWSVCSSWCMTRRYVSYHPKYKPAAGVNGQKRNPCPTYGWRSVHVAKYACLYIINMIWSAGVRIARITCTTG